MWIEESATFRAAAGEVYATMTTTDFQDEKARALDAVEFESAVSHDSDAVSVVSRRTMIPAKVPELIKSMVEPRIKVTETEVWQASNGRHHGSFNVDVVGAPIQVAGEVRIDELPGAGGCTVTFCGDLTTSVPLFRKAIEKAAASQVTDTIKAEFRLLADKYSSA